MKKIIYSMLALLIIGITGCVQDDIVQPNAQTAQDGEVAVQFSVTIPEYQTVLTRANGGVNDLILLVFDENGKFIYMRTATLSGQTENGGTFTVMMQPTANKRIVHFISNYEFADDFYDNALGKSEQEVVNALQSDKLLFWNRTELTSISDTPDPGVFNNGQPVKLLRNQAKISIEIEKNVQDFELQGFAFYKAPDKGTAAPEAFTIGTITPASGMNLSGLPVDDDFTKDEQYIFERIHKDASDYTSIIIKGLYKNNPQPCYYKIDLLDKTQTPAVRHDIERNYHYKIKIDKINMRGGTDIASTADGAASNNVTLDTSLDKFPIISDGTEKIAIEKTVLLFTEAGKEFAVQANYWPDITADPDNIENNDMTLYVEGESSIFAAEPTVNSSGLIQATITNTLPSELSEAVIVVSKGNLSRKLRVLVTQPFALNPEINDQAPLALLEHYIQDTDVKLTFTIPNSYPSELLPLDVKIYSEGLYPVQKGLRMEVVNKKMCYTYTATTTGVQTVNFKTNNDFNSETVSLNASAFTDAQVEYSFATRTIEGTIQWEGKANDPGAWFYVPATSYELPSSSAWRKEKWFGLRTDIQLKGYHEGTTFEMVSNGHYKITFLVGKALTDKIRVQYKIRDRDNTPEGTSYTRPEDGFRWYKREQTKTIQELIDDPNWLLKRTNIRDFDDDFLEEENYKGR